MRLHSVVRHYCHRICLMIALRLRLLLLGGLLCSPPLMSMVPVRAKSLPVSSAARVWLHMGAT
jgi:hypothetical protein